MEVQVMITVGDPDAIVQSKRGQAGAQLYYDAIKMEKQTLANDTRIQKRKNRYRKPILEENKETQKRLTSKLKELEKLKDPKQKGEVLQEVATLTKQQEISTKHLEVAGANDKQVKILAEATHNLNRAILEARGGLASLAPSLSDQLGTQVSQMDKLAKEKETQLDFVQSAALAGKNPILTGIKS